MVSQALLQELKTIIQEEYGVRLEQQVVADIGNTLAGFFELLAKVESEDKHDNENSGSSNS